MVKSILVRSFFCGPWDKCIAVSIPRAPFDQHSLEAPARNDYSYFYVNDPEKTDETAMTKIIEVPPLGEQKQTETLLNFWYVAEGEAFKSGDDLAELVTDKAAFNLPAPEAGRVIRLLIKEGAKVKPGDKLLEIDTVG